MCQKRVKSPLVVVYVDDLIIMLLSILNIVEKYHKILLCKAEWRWFIVPRNTCFSLARQFSVGVHIFLSKEHGLIALFCFASIANMSNKQTFEDFLANH